MAIVRNEVTVSVAGIGPVAFEPFQSVRGTYWHERYGRTHSQSFHFESDGREYWGEVIRTFAHDATVGRKRATFDVSLSTRDSNRITRRLPETHKAAWRAALIRHFRGELESFLNDCHARTEERAARHVERFEGATPEGATLGAAENGNPDAIEVVAIQAEGEPAPSPVRANLARQREGMAAIAEREAGERGGPGIRQVIDATPTWSGILPALILALTDGTPEGRKIAREELARMAALADERNTMAREQAARIPVKITVEDMPDGTFSVSADGPFGVPVESEILQTYRVAERTALAMAARYGVDIHDSTKIARDTFNATRDAS